MMTHNDKSVIFNIWICDKDDSLIKYIVNIFQFC